MAIRRPDLETPREPAPVDSRRRKMIRSLSALLPASLGALAVPRTSQAGLPGMEDERGDRAGHASLEHGAVFALTNAPGGNAVIAFARTESGALLPAGQYPAGGAGTGAGLGSQGAVIVSDDQRFLFAVNAGSDSIASFRIREDRLERIDVASSGGTLPTSITHRHGLLYVLNTGTPNNVTGFRVSPQGKLRMIPGSSRALSGGSTSPAQVGLDLGGDTLIVTERATNTLDTFAVNADGTLGNLVSRASSGPTPYGFAVGRRDTLLVSEAGAGGGASTYRIDDNGLQPVSAMIVTGQRAACWAVITPNGRFGYVSNAGTGNISGLAIARDRTAALLNADGVTAATGGNPADMAMSRDGQYLYARVNALASIAIFRIGRDGALWVLPPLTGTPANLAGLAGY